MADSLPKPTNPTDPAMIERMASDPKVLSVAKDFFQECIRYRYSYNFTWLGVSVIQYPQDLIALQEIIWQVQPKYVVETGIAHGGSLIFTASMLELLGGDRKVIGVDIDIREHNREVIESHPLAKKLELIQGSSVDPEVVQQVRDLVGDDGPVLVVLDSNHTRQHVLDELQAYASLVTPDSYLLVFDTIVEDLPAELIGDRPWGPGNSPMNAVHDFLGQSDDFEVDEGLEHKLLITNARGGYLKRRAA